MRTTMLVSALLALALVASTARAEAPWHTPPSFAALLADAAPVAVAPVALDGKTITPAASPDVTDVGSDLALAKELAGAARAKDYLLLVALGLLVVVGALKKLAGKVKALAFVDTHVGGLALNFVCAAAAVAVGADRAGIHFSWGLLEVAALAGLTAAGGWHAIVDPLLALVFPPKPAPVVGAKV